MTLKYQCIIVSHILEVGCNNRHTSLKLNVKLEVNPITFCEHLDCSHICVQYT